MGVVGVGQQVDVEAERDVADGRDLVLRRTPGEQDAPRGEEQLLHGVQTQTLQERTLHLDAGRHTGRETGTDRETHRERDRY